ncbi:MAG: CPBP family intramembrane metalloprotease [bacterium]|nr:CPBP family intramembrane metalloprotease [bacterium]
MEKWSRTLWLTFRVLFPYALYVGILSIVSVLFEQLGWDSVMAVTLVGACLSSALLYFLYRQERGIQKLGAGETVDILFLSLSACLGLNALLLLVAAPEESSKTVYAASLGMQLVTAGLAVPLVEEFLFRGLGFLRLREYMGFFPAALLSSLAFALYHGSLLQGIYAGCMGLLFAYLTEKKGGMEAAVLAHMTANLAALLLTACHADLWLTASKLRLFALCILSTVLFVRAGKQIGNNWA